MSDNQLANKKASNDQSLTSAVMSKKEDGDIRTATRIITSSDSPVIDNILTYRSLYDRHSPAPSGRHPFSDPSKFPTVQFTVEDVTAAIRSFPAGSAGGPQDQTVFALTRSHFQRRNRTRPHLCVHQFANARPVFCMSNSFRRQADCPTEEILQ